MNITAQPCFPHQLTDYSFVEIIYLGTRTTVYRAVETATQQSVVIKVLSQDYPSFAELVQFRNQYTVAKNLPIPGILQPRSLEPCGNGYGLVMDDFGGIDLEQYAKQHTLGLSEILSIAIQLVNILHELHQHRVIHKDIKPANILIHADSKQVKLIDFSIASLLPKETQSIQSPSSLEGTLAYMAPEQTGRMNRAIDYRTDFYALGVTLYQLLTGQLPFTKDDSLELIHCHMAQVPVAVDQIKPEVPAMVAKIVAKLMAKNAEDRYQSTLGLKYDLEQCLTQWKEQGDIVEFVLGKRDLCDRFLIPEKLYGREIEVQTLLDAFNRVAQGTAEMMLVAGFSGIGKTAVVNEVHKPIARQRGYFIKGKFDQFNRNIPLSAFVQALRDLIHQLLSESDTQLNFWKAQILEAVGENGQVLINVIPELEQVIGQQPPAPELSGSAALNRFNLLFQKFIQVFTRPEHPLVIFLDDLQWADSASLSLIKLLMAESKTGYLLLIGAYRDNEVFPAHPLMITLDTVNKSEATITTLTLQPLSAHSLNQLVADTLQCPGIVAQPLGDLVMQKTRGNPFFSTQFLKALHQEKMITYESDAGHWQCDIVQVRAAALTDDVVEFMALQLKKLPVATQTVLKLAACIGAQFDLDTLAIVSEQSPTEVAVSLWSALQEGLILPQSEIYKFYLDDSGISQSVNPETLNYKFLHDRIQQAAYSLIPEDQKCSTHFHIGQLLLQQTTPSQLDEQIFGIISHLNIGTALIVEQSQRNQLAQLNLLAGRKAKACTAYGASFEYLKHGLDLLPEDSWETDYALVLDFHLEATEVSYFKGDFELMDQFGKTVLDQASNLVDKAKVYETQLQAYSVQNKFLEGVYAGLECLKMLGIDLPNEPNQEEIDDWLNKTQTALAASSPEEILRAPKMSDPIMVSVMRILSRTFALGYYGRPSLCPLIACQGILLSLEYGNTSDTACSYVYYSVILCSPAIENFVDGYRYGKVAENLIEQIQDKQCQTIVLNMFYNFVSFWREHAHHGIPASMNGYQTGLEVGELEYATYALTNRVQRLYDVGTPLEDIQPEFESAIEFSRATKAEPTAQYVCCRLQLVLNLINAASEPWLLTGEAYDEPTGLEVLAQNPLGLSVHYFSKTNICYLFGRIFDAVEAIREGEKYINSIGSYFIIPEFGFFASLTYLAAAEITKDDERDTHLQRAKYWSDRLHLWAENAPMNYHHKMNLVEAEKQRILGHRVKALDLYDQAIVGAKENEYLQDEALTHELAAKFYLDWGKEKVAAGYMQEAYYCYSRWGAKAKITDLEAHYPKLLRPILQLSASSRDALNTFMTFATSTTSTHTDTHHSSNSLNLNQTIDFSSILKASQALSSTIQLDELLCQLTQIILQNSGSDRCVLILPDERGAWQVRAIATTEETCLYTESLTNNSNVPVKLIQYVKNTEEIVVINDLKTDLPVIDDYLRKKNPSSVLCLPLLKQGRLIGILDLNNHLTSGVFTKDRILVLNLLCSQIAISLENARLYQQAQHYAKQLEQSQLQLVQNEKMATLGNLVAGVAHEVNNPIGFLNGSVENAKDYIQDLFDHLDTYQSQQPPNEAVQASAEEVDLDFLLEDFPKLLNSMQTAADRITDISTSLRTFSRADTTQKVSVNIHEGLDSTLLILKYRLKANERRPAIEVLKHYGDDLSEINCFPAQLNQVFMNILANAIDMFDEMANHMTFEDLEKTPQTITINTVELAEYVEIRISDNGTGMTDEVQSRIFDHLFTTKEIGKGTGLGLAIAHQIIVETHGGSLDVQSELGQGTEFQIRIPLEDPPSPL